MKFIRFQNEKGASQLGWVSGDQIGPVHGNIYKEYQRGEATIPLSRVRLLPPLKPGKIICVGRNYAAHAQEHGAEVPEIPLLFLKPPSSVVGPGDPILLPPQSNQVEHEAELAVIIGQPGRWIKPEDALNHVFGYTIANDVTARDLQRSDSQWTRGKGFDTFCPLGPWIETEFDPSDAMITCHVNGELRQMASTRDMVFTIRQLIAFASTVMTLETGDLFLTGTPSGVSPLKAGDILVTNIDGIGSLENPIKLDDTRLSP